MQNISLAASGTICFGIVSLLCLVILHFVSKEFKPGFRMVSEYALGKHKWLLTTFFVCWGISAGFSGLMLWDVVTTTWAKLGVVLLFVTGIGAIMGGLFDVKHKLHGLSFAIGVPFLPIAALLISYHLINKPGFNAHRLPILLAAHSVWISVVLLGGSMFLLFSSLKATGIVYGPDSPPFDELPKGVIGINGFMNRLLVVCYIIYPVLIAKILLANY